MVHPGEQKPVVCQSAFEPLADPELERMLRERPDNRKAWLVYADWLIDQGDPRGEIIAAQACYRSVEELCQAHAATLLGPFALELADCVEIRWHMAYWKGVRVLVERTRSRGRPATGAALSVLEHVLAHPSARFLRELRVEQGTSWAESLVRLGVRPGLRRLSARQAADLSGLWAVLPDLEHLELDSAIERLGTLAAPRLRTLALRSPVLSLEPLQQLASATLPSLERLELCLSAQHADPLPLPLQPLLRGEHLPRLQRLSIRSATHAQTNALVELLMRSPLLMQLEELDLSWGGLTPLGGQRRHRHVHDLVPTPGEGG